MSLWPQTVGRAVYKNTKIINIKNNTLVVKTTTPVWKNELLFQKKEIIQKLNSNQKAVKVKDIKFI